MKKTLFKIFGDTKIFGWLFGIGIIIWLTLVGCIIYVAYHFISKYW